MNPRALSRRSFGELGLATTASLALGRAGQAAEEADWIDAHVHVWTPDVDRYPLDPGFQVSDMQPPSFTPEQLFIHTKPVGVTRVVLIQMSFYNYDNSYMLDMIAKHAGVFSGVGIVDHNAPGLATRMQDLAQKGVRGFRIHARDDVARGWVDNPGMGLLWKTAAKENLAVCPLINPTDIPYIDALCSKFGDTKVVVDHFARIGISGTIAAEQIDALCRLSRFPNVHVKTSAFYALGKKQAPYTDLLPMIGRLLDAFGPSRLMWASDCPYQVQDGHRYEPSLALIRDAAGLSDGDKQWLLRGTAEQLFF
jgi:predicted TIM-barrel fold metal-dependent hydrolase